MTFHRPDCSGAHLGPLDCHVSCRKRHGWLRSAEAVSGTRAAGTWPAHIADSPASTLLTSPADDGQATGARRTVGGRFIQVLAGDATRAISGLTLLLEKLSCRRGQLLAFACLLSSPLHAQKAPLAERDIADIATLLMLEDTRDFNSDVLQRILRSEHPELRRRAALSIARINDARGRALVRAAYPDRDTAVSATLVFGVGQMKDSAAVMWLDTLLKEPNTPVTVAFEAARSLGKIRTPNARGVLASYLAHVNEAAGTRAVIGEALLSIGRFKTRGDIAPVVRHTRSRDEEVRWRAAWALRGGGPATVPELLRLSADRSAIVRSWAVSGLTALRVDSSGVTRAAALQRLVAASQDTDRRVSTEAIGAMIDYDDDASFEVLRHAVDSRDTWLSVSAAEALARRRNRTDDAIAALMRAAQPDRPSALRIAAVFSLYALRPESARAPGEALATDTLPLSQQAAAELATLLASKPSANQPIPTPPDVSAPQRPIRTGRTAAYYRALAERWVVPVYRGEPAPRIEWKTPRGVVELELHSADAPLASEVLMQLLAVGAFIGSEFDRVVPNFVAQQNTLGRGIVLRDEVTRRGLTRGNLSWGSWVLDRGIPTYTLGIVPQPHNEGDFTTLGHVVRGMEVVDRIQMGDRIISARRIR
jgi:cyclophilin family peptidyl-prolyl cis-trans isomerase/HEAT repeat protein